ncbi:MAG: bifunctional riboflavin kinase/FAD synthetase [Cloacibacterium sp.]|nr:bifunctional riboflavin kinase/FAD synthetase [Cloacibacterium sp.]
MEIIQNLDDYNSLKPLALTLGMFDGVHSGHQSIIHQLKKTAHEKNLTPAILSFWPHPRKVLNPNEEIKLLSTLEEKLNLLEKIGIEKIFLQTFDETFRNLSGEDFVHKILIEKLHVQHLVIGHDHTFGKNKSGNFELLKKMSKKYDFSIQQIEALQINQLNVSSTKIRKALEEGHIKEANNMLGYPYSLSGRVVQGNQLGRTIGFPTANIQVENGKLLPKNAAYIVKVWVEEKSYFGMLNIGLRPTVDGKKLQSEVFILDFNQNIYGKTIVVEFLDFLRDEKKFNGIEELKAQLEIDKTVLKNYTHQ